VSASEAPDNVPRGAGPGVAKPSAWDAIIVGAGGMGSASAAHLAARGRRVLVIECFEPAHDRGSSHGLSRIIRLAYFEHPSYVPLLRRAFELWRALEAEAREPLLTITGGLDVGWEGSLVFEGSRLSCREHDLRHEVLSSAELQRRVPAWRLPGSAAAVFQPDGGFLRPERCILAHIARARAAGATVRTGERVLDWDAHNGRVRVRTDQGTYDAGQLVLAAGAWTSGFVPALATLFAPERQVVGWFDVGSSDRFSTGVFPVFVLEVQEGLFYGFPEHEVPGFKIGKFRHRHETVDPASVDRACHPEDEAALREAVSRYLPDADGRLLRHSTCIFTNTPDGHFVVDRHPGVPEVLIVSPCSGHGFKFCSVVGEIVADLVERNATRHDIGLFRLARFEAC
jgi:sarcosine oxidase